MWQYMYVRTCTCALCVCVQIINNFCTYICLRYFETFDVVSEVSTEDRLKMFDLTARCSSREALGESVSTNFVWLWGAGLLAANMLQRT